MGVKAKARKASVDALGASFSAYCPASNTSSTASEFFALSNYSKSERISPTRIGSRQVGGDAEFQSRYQRLANDVVDELWRLWNEEEIRFDDLPTNTYGESDRRRGYDICINRDYEPSLFTYHLPPEQSKLAAGSMILVHEAVHLVRGFEGEWELDEEIACRKLGTLYLSDLLRGLTYNSRVTGANCTARLLPNPPKVASFMNMAVSEHECDRHGQLIDFVLSDRVSYREYLTLGFVDRSFDWWGGIQNRLTKGYYLRALAAATDPDVDLMTRILESIMTYEDWLKVRSTAGDLGAIRSAGGYRMLAYAVRHSHARWLQWVGLEPAHPVLPLPTGLDVFERAELSNTSGGNQSPRGGP